LIESRQSYCNENRVQFFWPTRYISYVTDSTIDRPNVSELSDLVSWRANQSTGRC